MKRKTPPPPRPDRVRIIEGSFSWIDHRFLRQGFDRGLDRLEKLFYFVLITLSNREGVSFYSDRRLCQILQVRHRHEFRGAREQLAARDLIAFESGVYQVLRLARLPLPSGHELRRDAGRPPSIEPPAVGACGSEREPPPWRPPAGGWKSLRELLGIEAEGSDNE